MRLSTLGAVGRSGRVGVLAAPSNGVITITQPADNQLTFTWTWEANGAAITNYSYSVAKVSDSFIAVSGTTTATNITAANLLPEAYKITLTATNKIGSTTITKSQIVIGRAAAPSVNSLYLVSEGSLQISWTAPTDTGGSAIVKYYGRIRNLSDGEAFPATFTDLTGSGAVLTYYSWSNIVSNKWYMVELYGKNANQAGYTSTTAGGFQSFILDPPSKRPNPYAFTYYYNNDNRSTKVWFDSDPGNATSIEVTCACIGNTCGCYNGYREPTLINGASPSGSTYRLLGATGVAGATGANNVGATGSTGSGVATTSIVCQLGAQVYNQPYACKDSTSDGFYPLVLKFAYVNAAGRGPQSRALVVRFHGTWFTLSPYYITLLDQQIADATAAANLYAQSGYTIPMAYYLYYPAAYYNQASPPYVFEACATAAPVPTGQTTSLSAPCTPGPCYPGATGVAN